MFVVDPSNRADYYAYLARLNFACAEEADKKVGHLPGYEVAAPPPVMTLCAHAIELSLKSRLLKDGMSERDVKNLGHKLTELWKACKEHSEDPPDIDTNVLEIISDLLNNHRLRYGDKTDLGVVPVYGPLSDLVRQCLAFCNAPKLEDLGE